MILALLLKEAQHHGLVVLGTLVVTAAITLMGWAVGLQQDYVTLLIVAHGVLQVGMPLLVLFIDDRVVAQDHVAGTHEFLAALPVSPAARTAIRWFVGASVITVAAVGVLLSTALLASRREGVPFGFLVELGVAFGAYLFAWHGLAFGIAHLGRFRWLTWWLVLTVEPLLGAFVDRPQDRWLWFGLVSDGADRLRQGVPWSALVPTLAWGVFGTALGFGLATWRGGALLERWFRPPTGDQRAQLVGVGIGAVLVVGLLGDLGPDADRWKRLRPLPAEHATVRVVGRALADVGPPVVAALDRAGASIGVDAWPPVVLVRGRPEPTEPLVTSLGSVNPAVTRMILVDPSGPRPALVRRVLAEVFLHRLAGLGDWDEDLRLVADGYAGWLVPGDDAALAALGAGRAADALRDYPALLREVGPDVGAAVARAGFVALERTYGERAVHAVAAAALKRPRRPDWPSGLSLRLQTRPGFAAQAAGADEARWLAAWEAELSSSAPPLAPEWPPLAVASREGEVVLSWTGDPQGAELEWIELDPLQRWPLPGDAVERERPGEGTEVGLTADARARVAARWVRRVEGLGRLTSAWVVSW